MPRRNSGVGITFKRNDDYFVAGKPYLDGMKSVFLTGDGFVNAIMGGQVDAGFTSINPPINPPINPKGNLPDCYLVSAGVDNYRNANKLNGCLNDAHNTTAAFKASKAEARPSEKAVLCFGSIDAFFESLSTKAAPSIGMVV